jgi:hypothetical protein
MGTWAASMVAKFGLLVLGERRKGGFEEVA